MSQQDELRTLSYFERKEYEELKYAFSEEAKRKRERVVFLGFFVIAIVATLILRHALDFS